MKVVNQPVMKKDAMSLVTGKPVFLDDVVPDNALVVKVKRSPYAHALIEEIKIDTALKVPGKMCIRDRYRCHHHLRHHRRVRHPQRRRAFRSNPLCDQEGQQTDSGDCRNRF